MPRTAPTVNGTPNLRRVSWALIDASGDKRSVSLEIDLAATDINIEAATAAIALATNANIYRVTVEDIYNDLPSVNDADELEENSVFDNIVLLMKDPTNRSQNFFLPAPKRENFVGDSDNPDAGSVMLGDWRDAVNQLAYGTTSAISLRYTERREKNQAVPAQE